MENTLVSVIGNKTDGQKSTQVPGKPSNFGNVGTQGLCVANIMWSKVPKRNQEHRHTRSVVHSHAMCSMAGARETLVVVKSICKTCPQGRRARADGVLN